VSVLSSGRLGGAVLTLLLAGLQVGCDSDAASSLERGDRLLGLTRFEEAVAEYKLARRQGDGNDLAALLRLAHAHAAEGDAETSLGYYREVLARDSSYRYQATADLAEAARRTLERGGRERMARILEPVLEFGLTLVPRDLRLEMALHYSERSEFRQALPLYLSILDGEEEVGHRTRYEVARAYEALGACREALPHFEVYLRATDGGAPSVAGARWHYGRCLYEAAVAAERAGEEEEALARLDRLVEVGVPRTLLDRAHYLRGELLLAADRREEALEAFRQVLRLNPARTGPLPAMAREKILRIRYEY